MTAVTYQTFVTAFPAFDDTDKYPEGTVQFWLDQAALQISQSNFGSAYPLAVYYFTAHNLVIDGRANGGGGGTSITGLASSKSIDGVSMSYDTGSVVDKDAGFWNATIYGQRYWQLLKSRLGGARLIPGRDLRYQYPRRPF